VTSARKLEANKSNASRSTGPRTPGGKSRSRLNARRHGLATRIEDDPAAMRGIECLILAEGADDFERMEKARFLAECHFDLQRVGAARCEVFAIIDDLEKAAGDDFENALRAMENISRYETRAFSKRKRALRKSPRKG
jgi:hypothetical protein